MFDHQRPDEDIVSHGKDLMARQLDAVQRGDTKTASETAELISLSLPSLKKSIQQARWSGDAEGSTEAQAYVKMLEDMREMNRQSLSAMIRQRDELAIILQNLRKSRQLIRNYKSPRKQQKRVLELAG